MHGGGTHGVLVQFDTDDATAAKAEFTAFGKDIAMQIAAANPGYLCEAEVPVSVIEKEGDPAGADQQRPGSWPESPSL